MKATRRGVSSSPLLFATWSPAASLRLRRCTPSISPAACIVHSMLTGSIPRAARCFSSKAALCAISDQSHSGLVTAQGTRAMSSTAAGATTIDLQKADL